LSVICVILMIKAPERLELIITVQYDACVSVETKIIVYKVTCDYVCNVYIHKPTKDFRTLEIFLWKLKTLSILWRWKAIELNQPLIKEKCSLFLICLNPKL